MPVEASTEVESPAAQAVDFDSDGGDAEGRGEGGRLIKAHGAERCHDA